MVQDEALDLLKLGYNAYLTGPAGSGKTYLLNKYIEYLKEHKIRFGVTASTGIAATHLNGMTIHSWAGIGVKDKLKSQDITELLNKPYLIDRFFNSKVLIIDEISMLDAKRLDMVDRVCRAFKDKSKPFGGLQLIMCGDFFQLPPVSKNGKDSNFVFKSDIWNEMDLKICYLTEQYRQSDLNFLSVLNDIRNNNANEDTLNSLMSRYNKEVTNIKSPTKLYTHNVDVDAINNMELSKINKEPHTFQMTSTGEQALVDFLKKSCLAPETLIAKKGAVVMFVKNNFDKGYVNGTLGKVTGYDNNGFPKVVTTDNKEIIASPTSWTIEEDGLVKASVSQVPLRLAWAITVHKSQGMSLDAAEMDLSKSFVTGMGYVALSRVRTLKGVKLVGLNSLSLRVNENIVEFDNELRARSELDKKLISSLTKKKLKEFQNKFVELLQY